MTGVGSMHLRADMSAMTIMYTKTGVSRCYDACSDEWVNANTDIVLGLWRNEKKQGGMRRAVGLNCSTP